jgi:hypothetical protein
MWFRVAFFHRHFLIFSLMFSFSLELNGIIQMYAYDTVITYSASSLDELFRMINEDMVLLQTWLSANMLALNIEKTNFVLFERRDGQQFVCLITTLCDMEMVLCKGKIRLSTWFYIWIRNLISLVIYGTL